MARWSPYVVGIGIGLLSCVSFLLSDKPIGCSTAFSRTSGMIERLFRGGKVAEKAYYQKIRTLYRLGVDAGLWNFHWWFSFGTTLRTIPSRMGSGKMGFFLWQ